MKVLFLITLMIFNLNVWADCRGCCSHHGGVTCSGGITECRDGTPLSSKCMAKGCEKCDSNKSETNSIQEVLNDNYKGI